MTDRPDLDAMEGEIEVNWGLSQTMARHLLTYARTLEAERDKKQKRIEELEKQQEEIYEISRTKDWKEGPFEARHAFDNLEEIQAICLSDQAKQASKAH